ncbi:MAG TPA: ABC transporter permease, partial [Candidatus Acidoferrales bacterium]
MSRVREWMRRVAGLFHKRRRDAELEEELAAHLAMLTEQNVERGMTAEDARRAARIELGGAEQIKEAVREQRGVPLLESLWQDVRFALRMLRKNPGFATVAILTLALGIGATTTIFSAVYGVLLRPLPFAQPTRIVAVWEIAPNGNHVELADPNFDDFRDQNRTFQVIAKYASYEDSVANGTRAIRTIVAPISPGFMQVLRATPFIGRDFTNADDQLRAAPTCIVNYGFWRDFLGSTHDLEHASLKVENTQYGVIGVMPPGFQFPQTAMVWIPADLQG